jgi:GPH family glycoside/pentoside/hexuronide:cation symporter/probable glucitol transport protein GutA
MSSVSETIKTNEMERLPFWRLGVFGLGNFASNLSWTMVSSYLAIFYTDAVGISATAVATLLLVSRIWDAANDPIMGHIAERTRSRWGRFRPYILFGPPVLAVLTILTFRNPGLGGTGNLVYAYITYTILTMVYTVTNVPYLALPNVIARNRNDVPRLGAAILIGMNVAQIVLMNVTIPMVTLLGGGDMSRGYQTTATVFALAGMLLFWVVFAGTKEVITFTKKSDVPHLESFRILFKSRNIICCILSATITMMGIMGRIGIMIYFYLHVIKRPDLMGIFMSGPMIIGLLVAPFAPALARKVGFKGSAVVQWILNVVGIGLIYLSGGTNFPVMIIGHIIYGLGYIGGSTGMLRDAVDEAEYKTGVRIDGTVSGFSGFATKTGGAIGSSIGLFVIGFSGYVGGQEVTPAVAAGINQAVNLVPVIVIALGIIPLALYNLSEKEGKRMHDELEARRDRKAAEAELHGNA